MSMAHVIFAGGCFWGMQAVFDAVQGVVSTEHYQLKKILSLLRGDMA